MRTHHFHIPRTKGKKSKWKAKKEKHTREAKQVVGYSYKRKKKATSYSKRAPGTPFRSPFFPGTDALNGV
jgi:hypothetical protein